MTEEMKRSFNASAPGKVIILGEHFVVHGSNALAVAIEKRVRVSVNEQDRTKHSVIISNGTKTRLTDEPIRYPVIQAVARRIQEKFGNDHRKKFIINVISDIPPGSGLGSSAAVSVATTAALSRFLGHKLSASETLETASFGEKSVHGNPSGIDTAVSFYGGALLFNREKGPRKIFVKKPVEFLIVFSGIHRKTGVLVGRVGERRKLFPNTFSAISKGCSKSSSKAARSLQHGDLILLGDLMNEGQTRLFWAGVSNRQLDFLIEDLHQDNLCYGAKLTGAGGGGSVVALPRLNKTKQILRTISRRFPYSFLSKVPQNGLTLEGDNRR